MGDFGFDDDDFFGGNNDGFDSFGSSDSSGDSDGFDLGPANQSSDFGSGGNGFDGFGSDNTGSDDSSIFDPMGGASNSSGATNETQSSGSSPKKKKKICFLFIGLGIAGILIYLWVIGNNSQKEQKADEPSTEVVENSTDESEDEPKTSTVSTDVEEESDEEDEVWTAIDELEVKKFEKKTKGTMHVSNIEYFSTWTEGKDYKLQLRAEAIGAVDGLNGTYRLVIPWRFIEGIEIGDDIPVYYTVCSTEYGKFIADVELAYE